MTHSIGSANGDIPLPLTKIAGVQDVRMIFAAGKDFAGCFGAVCQGKTVCQREDTTEDQLKGLRWSARLLSGLLDADVPAFRIANAGAVSP